jgi:hypothetical protein
MTNGDRTYKRGGLPISKLAVVRELGPQESVHLQCSRCEQTDVFNLAILPVASDAPPFGGRDVIQARQIRSEATRKKDWRRAFFQDAFYTLLTTAFLIALFSALVATIG